MSCDLLKEDSSSTNDAALALLANSPSNASNCIEFAPSESTCILEPNLESQILDSLESFFAC